MIAYAYDDKPARAQKTNKIIELRQLHPTMTLQAIGEHVGVSKERVRQILKKENLPTVSKGNHSSKAKEILPCIVCGSIDKKRTKKHALTCNNECRKQSLKNYWKNNPIQMTTFQCHYCGQEKLKAQSQIKKQASRFLHMYCSYSCRIKAYWKERRCETDYWVLLSTLDLKP